MRSCSEGKLLLYYFKFTTPLLRFIAWKTPLLSAGIFKSGPALILGNTVHILLLKSPCNLYKSAPQTVKYLQKKILFFLW